MNDVKLAHHGDVAVVTPHGYLVGGEETDSLSRALVALDQQGARKLVINLIETDHMDSTALGVLMAARRDFSRRAARIRLCHLNERIHSALLITRVDHEFDVYATEREAVESFGAGAGSPD